MRRALKNGDYRPNLLFLVPVVQLVRHYETIDQTDHALVVIPGLPMQYDAMRSRLGLIRPLCKAERYSLIHVNDMHHEVMKKKNLKNTSKTQNPRTKKRPTFALSRGAGDNMCFQAILSCKKESLEHNRIRRVVTWFGEKVLPISGSPLSPFFT